MSANYGPNPSYEDLNVFNNSDIPQENPVPNMSLDVVDYVHGLSLPSCAMSFNGIIFEDEFPGYRTIRVEGRDSFSRSIYDYSTRINPGSRFQGEHEESKEIIVTFSQHAYDYYDLRKRLDQIRATVLNPDNNEAQIIFADEWDVYYLGTVSSFKIDKLVNNSNAAGQITIKCSDVRKYAVAMSEELVADSSNGYRFDVDYNGSRPSYPIFKVKMPNSADIDYFGFVNQNGKILQFGTVKSVDSDVIEKPSNRINQNFLKTFPADWGKSQDLPTPNHATVSTDMENAIVQHGELNRDPDTGAHAKKNDDGTFPGYGTWDSETMAETPWHGPSTTRSIGSNDCKDWKMSTLITQWQREPQIDALNVVLKNDYEVLACVGNKLHFAKTIDIGFAAYEGAKQVPCKVTSITAFLNAELVKNQAAKNNADGLLRFKLARDSTVQSNTDNPLIGEVTITFLVTYSGGTRNVTKKFHWVINRLDASVGYNFNVFFQKYEFILDCDSANKTKAATEIDVPFVAYKGTSRISANLSTSADDRKIFGIAPTVTNTTSSTVGHVKYTIPQGTLIDVGSDNEASKSLSFSVTIDGQSQTVQDTFKIRRNTGSTDVSNGNSLVRVPLGLTGIIFPCRVANKTFLSKTIKIIFGGWEGTSRRACEVNSVELLGQKPKIEQATKDKNGWIQWTIPAGTAIPWETNSKRLTFTVTTDKYGKVTVVREIMLKRETMDLTMTDYSQLGGMVIVVAGTNVDNENRLQSIAEIQLFKNQTKSTKATCSLYLNNLKKTSFQYECVRTNAITGTDNGKNKTGSPIEIEKIGNQYVFSIGGKKYSYTNSNNLLATEVSFIFLKFKNNNVLERNSVKNIKLIQYPNLQEIYGDIYTRKDESNFLYADDEIEINCGTGEILVNGVPKYGYGQLGNDWEEFFLSPGANSIECVWDDSGKSPLDYEGNIYYMNQDFIKNSDYKKGQFWIVQNEAEILGFDCVVGDIIACIHDKDGSYSHNDFIKTTGDQEQVEVSFDPTFTMQYREVY